MRRSLAVLVLAWIAACSLWGQSPRMGTVPSHNPKKQTAAPSIDQRGTKDLPFVVDALGHKNTEQETAEADKEKHHRALIDGWTLVFAGAVALFTGILIIVGNRGVNAANRTLTAIKKQARLMARQIDLQERQMRQWVRYGKWHSWVNLTDQGIPIMGVRLEIDNPTGLPITLPSAAVVFISLPNNYKHRYYIRENCILLPNNPQTIAVQFPLTESDLRQFDGDGILFRVEGDVTHLGTLQKIQEQLIRGTLSCSRGGTNFYEETPQQADPTDNT